MKLYYTPTSPFVRKVTVAAHELGLASRLETTFLRPSPLATDAVLSHDNPLSKIPVLITDDGLAIYDSNVICEYLDTLHAGPKLIPAAGVERWTVLRRQALASGLLEAAIQVFYERMHRPKELQWSPWMDGQMQKVTQALDALEREAPSFSSGVDLGAIAIGTTLGWLEFRSVHPSLREGRAALFTWYDELRRRPSMVATEPKA